MTRWASTVVVGVLALGLLTVPERAVAVPPGGMSATDLAAMFRTYGDAGGHWTGGDSTASVVLPDGRVVWLFSDTFLGAVNPDGTRPANAPMVNNTIVVQDGTSLVATLHGGTVSAPLALVRPSLPGEYWVGDGTIEGGSLKVLYNRWERVGSGALDVTLRGTALVTFALPALTVSSVVDLPLGSTIAWGSAILEDGAYTYVYGSSYVPADRMKFGHVARVPAGGLGGPWQFWTGSTWSTVEASAARLLSGVGTAYAVQRVGSQYVLVTMEGNLVFNPQVVAYTATSPTGPFGGPLQLFTAPEPQPGRAIIVYDTRVHPDLARSGKLLVSYNVNSLDSADNLADARLYRPRFVEVDWPRPAPDPGVPPAPTGMTGTADAAGLAHLSWPPVAGAQSYRIYVRDVTAGQTHFARSPSVLAGTSMDYGLVSDHTTEFRVAAVNAAGEGALSNVASVVTHIAPPPAPTGVTATANTTGRITVAWAPVPAAWNYEVYRRDVTAGEAEFSFQTRLGGQQTSLDVDWLEHNHAYEFYVVASHGGGNSPASATVSATAGYALPGAPTGLTLVANADGTIGLSWTAPGPDVWFNVYQRDVTAGETVFTKLPLPITSCCAMTAGYLAHNHEYEYKVAATNRGGEGPASNTARATARYPVPAAPSGLAAAAGNGQAVLTWSASPTPDVWYNVYQRDVTAGESTFTKLPLPITSCCTMTAGYLANGHLYEFKVTAIGQGGESPASNVVPVTPQLPPPGKPTALTATANTDGTITLSWTPPAGEGLWFNIYQRDVTAGESTFTKLPLPITSCCTMTAGYLVHNHVYQYKVSATNGGESPLSDPAQATARYNPPPAPTNLRGVSSGDGAINLNWDGPGSVYYWIYIRDVTAGQTTFTRSFYPTAATEMTWGMLAHGHLYEFKVTAENPGGEGPASATIQVTSFGGLPLPPSSLTATAGDGQVVLRWTASPTAGVWYWVYQRDVTAGQSWQKLPLPISSCCTMTAGLLANGHTYEFKVVANNSAGDSGPSNVASARPLPPFPLPPTGLTATPGDGKVTLHWTASPTPNVWYWVEMRPAGGSWQRLPYPVSTCCTLPVVYLANGTTYEFRLRSNNLAGDSAPSNVASARPMPPLPQPPTGLTATPGDGKVTLKWTASPTPNVWYWVEMRSAGGSWQRLLYPVTTCCTLPVVYLFNGTTYEFRLRSTNLAGDSAPSNVASARPMPPFPQAPTNVRATGAVATVSLTWTASTTPGTWYWIYYRNASTGQTAWSKTSWFVTGTSAVMWDMFHNGDVYEFQVAAFNLSGEARSSTVDAVPRRRLPGSSPTRWMNVINGANGVAAGWALGQGFHCQHDYWQQVCFGRPPSITGQPITVGDIFFYPGNSTALEQELVDEAYERLRLRRLYGASVAAQYGPDVLRHEARHSEQWADYIGWGFYAADYGVEAWESQQATGSPACQNWFEQDANLYWGGYSKYGSVPGEECP